MDPFDELAQAFARGISRRTALRRFAGGLLTVAVAAVLPGKAPAVANAIGLYAQGVGASGASVSGASVPSGTGQMASFWMGSDGPRVEAIQFLLRQNGELTYEQIAEARGAPVGTVKTQMRTALQKLRKILNPEPSIPDE